MEDLNLALIETASQTIKEGVDFSGNITIEGLLIVTVDETSSLLIQLSEVCGTAEEDDPIWKRRCTTPVAVLKEKIEMSLLSVCWERLVDAAAVQIDGLVTVVIDSKDILTVYLDKLTQRDVSKESNESVENNEILYLVMEHEGITDQQIKIKEEPIEVKEEETLEVECLPLQDQSQQIIHIISDPSQDEIETKQEIAESHEGMETEQSTETVLVQIDSVVEDVAQAVDGLVSVEPSLENTVIVEASPHTSLQQILMETLTGEDRQQAAAALSALSEEPGWQDAEIQIKTKFSCHECGIVFDNKKSLSWHQKQQHPNMLREDTTKCRHCGKQLNKAFVMSGHNCNLKCTVCDSVFKTRTKLNVHMRGHRKEEYSSCPFKCPKCSKRFSKLKYLQQHEKTYHITSLFDLALTKLIDMRGGGVEEKRSCFLCDKKFMNFAMLRKHMIQHQHSGSVASEAMIHLLQRGDTKVMSLFREEVKSLTDICLSHVARPTCKSGKEFACRLCTKDRMSRFELLRHMRLHQKKRVEGYMTKHGKRKYACPSCFRKFATQKNRDLHVQLHHISSSVSFTCSECKREFKTMFNLERHMELHEFHNKQGTSTMFLRRYKCTVPGCRSAYTSEAKLKDHLQEPHVIEPQNIVTEASPTKDGKRKRGRPRVVHSETEFQCPSCNKTFGNAARLKRHEKLHEANSTKLRPFQCDRCISCFASEDKLKLHIKDKHNPTEEGKIKKEKPYFSGGFLCVTCGYQCSSKFNLQRHEQRYHSGEVARRGRPPDKVEPSMAKFRNVTGSYECPICTKVMKTPYSARRHIRTHGELHTEGEETILVLDENLFAVSPNSMKLEI